MFPPSIVAAAGVGSVGLERRSLLSLANRLVALSLASSGGDGVGAFFSAVSRAFSVALALSRTVENVW